MKWHLYYIIVLILLFINSINTKCIVKSTNNDKRKDNKDRYYLIYVNNTYGEYNIFSETKIQKRQESQVFIESLVDDINDLIIKNKDTYHNQKKLKEIEKSSHLKTKKRNLKTQKYYSYDESSFVYPISSVKDRVVLYAYLSNTLISEIRSKFESVIDIVPNKRSSSINHKNYNVDDILAETNWKNLTVRENADFHLSLVSQGKFNKNLTDEYDNNYYYPSSAGKDVDIVILDSSFHFDYHEFSNKDDRIAKCAGNIVDGKVSLENIDHDCGLFVLCHGEVVSDTAAGLVHGIANRANVYGISIPLSGLGEIEDSDMLGGLQFIYENMIRPHKTVVNLSIGGRSDKDSEYYKHYKSLIDGITEKGGIVVSAAGNDGYNLSEKSFEIIPCQFDNVICVGGFKNEVKQFDEKDNSTYVYQIAPESNFGKGVDIYAPMNVDVEIVAIDEVFPMSESGTSFSTPIVAGIIATIISENNEIKYTKETMYKKLFENGKFSRLNINKSTKILANNGKHIVYSGKQ